MRSSERKSCASSQSCDLTQIGLRERQGSDCRGEGLRLQMIGDDLDQVNNAAMLHAQLSSSIKVVISASVLLGHGRKNTSSYRHCTSRMYSLAFSAVALAVAVGATTIT